MNFEKTVSALEEEISSLKIELNRKENSLLNLKKRFGNITPEETSVSNDEISKYRFILENTSEEFFLLSLNGRILLVNNSASESIGYSQIEIQGEHISVLNPEMNSENFSKLFTELREKKTISREICHIAKNGSKHIKEMRYVYMNISGSDFVCAFSHDITSKIKTLNSLKESEERYRALMANLPEIVIIHHNDMIIYANDTLEKITGYSAHEVYGKSLFNIIDSASCDEFQNLLDDSKKDKSSSDLYDIVFITKSVSHVKTESRSIKIHLHNQTLNLTVFADVTKRKAMEELLSKEHGILNRVIMKNPVAMAIFGKDGRRIKSNTAFDKIFGSDFDDNYTLFTDPLLSNYTFELEKLNKGETVEIQNFRHNRNNYERYLHISGFSIKNTDNGIDCYVAIIEDITAEKADNDMRKKLEEHLRNYFDFPLIGLGIISENFLITDANQKFSEYLKTERNKLIGKKYSDIFPENTKNTMQNLLTELFSEKTPFILTESKAVRGDGEEIDINISARIVKSGKGSLPYAIVVLQDITEFKQTNEKIADEREKLFVTLKSISEAIITIDSGYKIILMNQNAEKLTQISQEQALGKKVGEVLKLIDEENRNLTCEIVHDLPDGTTNRYQALTKDGESVPAEISISSVFDKSGKLSAKVITIKDISEKKQHEENMLKSLKLESLGILAGGIAHDFNNILTTILGNISLAKIWIGDSETRILKAVLDAEKASMKAKDLTHQLLTLSKGGLPVKTTASAYELIIDSVDLAFHDSAIICEFDIEDNLWNIEIDESQISQVLHNLLLNARQAMEDTGKVTIKCSNFNNNDSINPFLDKGNFVRFIIQDSGAGIPKDILPNIFDPYFTTKPTGHGLGLAISYSIVKNHCGHIDVESEVGSGTVFTLYLPAIDKEIKEKTTAKPLMKNKNLRILVLEDEENILTLLSRIFEHYEYDYVFTSNGNDTIKEYEKSICGGKPFDAVLLDLTIPGGMGGKETFLNLRKINPSVKGIVSSGYSNDDAMSNFIEYGFSARIIKPYNIEDLIRTITEVVSCGKQL
ncbi:MAG: PAS domain S-box protein [Spirochaetes bacterium]|nr:PAS domain S-box protein [Spirochaetota bacterium]